MGEQLHDPEIYVKCILFSILTCFDIERQTFCIQTLVLHRQAELLLLRPVEALDTDLG